MLCQTLCMIRRELFFSAFSLSSAALRDHHPCASLQRLCVITTHVHHLLCGSARSPTVCIITTPAHPPHSVDTATCPDRVSRWAHRRGAQRHTGMHPSSGWGLGTGGRRGPATSQKSRPARADCALWAIVLSDQRSRMLRRW